MRRLVAVVVLALIIVAFPTPAQAVSAPGCPKAVREALGYCPTIDKNDRFVEVSGDKSTSDRSGSSNSSETRGSNSGNAIYTPPPRPRTRDEKFSDCNTLWDLLKRCIPVADRPTDGPAPEDPRATQPITITDLASFSPAPGKLTGEPDNLGVAGLPTNFTADAAAHTRTGALFGYPVTARFTPASFVFRYGDGQTRTTTTAGKTWEALNLPQFTPTDTSHTYAERGTYQASVDTVYTAEIDLGTGYFPISGTLTIPGPPQSIQIYEARTALVAHTCDEDPTAEGCPAS